MEVLIGIGVLTLVYVFRKQLSSGLNESERNLENNRNKVRDEFIEFYGSYDAIPDSVKKVIER